MTQDTGTSMRTRSARAAARFFRLGPGAGGGAEAATALDLA